MSTLIRGGTVVSASHASVADVLIDGEEIVAVGEVGDAGAEVVDATGLLRPPGPDRQPHAHGDAVRRHPLDRRLRHRHARGRRGRHHVHRRLRIQQEGGGLQSSLDEWQERAAGAAHVDYGFHVAITQADEGTFADMPRWSSRASPASRSSSPTRAC